MASAIEQAVALHRKGQLGEAEQLYNSVLAAEPSHFDALHLLGVLMHQRGRSAEALDLIGKALAANARSADAHANFGRVLAALRRSEEAIASFDKALALKPDHAEALFHRGNALVALQKPEQALANYDRLLAVTPNYAQAHINRGVALRALRRFDEAAASYECALAISPGAPAGHVNLGNVLLDLRRPADALACYDRALVLQPDNIDALYNRGNALLALKRHAESLAAYDKVLALAPGHASTLANRGLTLRDLKRPEEALACLDRALVLDPLQRAETLNNRGNVLSDLNRFADALADFDAALALQPDNAELAINRGNALINLRRVDEAISVYGDVLARHPEHAEAHYNRALARLATGDLTRGFRDYEWRARKREDNDVRVFGRPRWAGAEPIQGRTVLLHAEQGFGDTIQFIRYAPMVAAKGATVIVEAPRALHPLIEGVDGVSAVLSRDDTPPPFDWHCPLLSLPLAFGTTLETVPASVPYLSAPDVRVDKWRAILPAGPSLRIGIAWSGNPAQSNDHNRSVPLSRFVGLAAIPGVQLVGIQRDLRAADAETLRQNPEIVSLGDQLGDFADTAAAISLLDVVIAVDTSVAHLAGALGKPLWVLLWHGGDWRWMLEGETSPWYPAARLFRQTKVGDWESVFARVQSELTLKLRQR